ncbi:MULTISPECIES: hypothetical protein [unclassified Bradyrhizobium]|uniref:hypothetical protein n=1 Tax=unclassified Bradyrhizobium TaxID=2631580 RepID=UPI002FE5F9FC
MPHAVWQPWFMVKPQPGDNRFAGRDWTLPAFNVMAQAFLLGEQWWHSAASGLHDVSKGNAAIVDFTVRQCLDVVAPSNFAFSNPEVLREAMDSGGGNFVPGWRNWLEDCRDLLSARPSGPAPFVVGKNVAATKGKVVYRNELIELIQYAPETADVCPEPVLIVPAWIMKYYILDLSPQNSLVRFLVQCGFTVFMISWRNPGPADRELGLDHYRKLGSTPPSTSSISCSRTSNPCGWLLPWRDATRNCGCSAAKGAARLPALGDALGSPGRFHRCWRADALHQ